MDAHRRYAISRVAASQVVSNEQKRIEMRQKTNGKERMLQVKTAQRLRDRMGNQAGGQRSGPMQ